MLAALPAHALDRVGFTVVGGNEDLTADLRAASSVVASVREGRTAARELLSASLADYARLLEALYANGYYGGVISVRLNGREAADIPLLSGPERVETLNIRVDPGRPFRFGRVRISPRPPGAQPLDGLSSGAPALSGVVRRATETVIEEWREIGHAKAALAGQRVVANHDTARLRAEIDIAPGPRLRFGDLRIPTPSAVRKDRIRRIAGFSTGAVFSPGDLENVAKRLRRAGAFSSVTLDEADAIGADGTLDVTLHVADALPRRFGFGAELSSLEGLDLTAFWLHRNAFGGAERLRFDGAIEQIAGARSDIDYSAGVRLDIPAYLGPDTTGFVRAEFEHLDEPNFASDTVDIGAGASWFLSDQLRAEGGIGLLNSRTEDAFGTRTLRLLTFPTSLTLDARDDTLDPTRGHFLNAQVTGFVGLSGAGTGLRAYGDARIYRPLGGANPVVVAGRLQVGSIVGPSLSTTPPDFLFFSGGGGTVRGQEDRSLGIDLGNGRIAGGRSSVGLALEARIPVAEQIGTVVFADAGYVGAESFFDGSGEWHFGAGLGLRYRTALGPIRLDVATPLGNIGGTGPEIYIGIGQAF